MKKKKNWKLSTTRAFKATSKFYIVHVYTFHSTQGKKINFLFPRICTIQILMLLCNVKLALIGKNVFLIPHRVQFSSSFHISKIASKHIFLVHKLFFSWYEKSIIRVFVEIFSISARGSLYKWCVTNDDDIAG